MSVMRQQLEQIRGRIVNVVFFDENDGYTVLRMELDDGSQAIVVGCIPLAANGERLTAWGSWTRHATHGEQFKVEYVERFLPTGRQGHQRDRSGNGRAHCFGLRG